MVHWAIPHLLDFLSWSITKVRGKETLRDSAPKASFVETGKLDIKSPVIFQTILMVLSNAIRGQHLLGISGHY